MILENLLDFVNLWVVEFIFMVEQKNIKLGIDREVFQAAVNMGLRRPGSIEILAEIIDVHPDVLRNEI
ncbi:MAG: hypothetical protein Q7K55_08740, partial [Candidatus Levybacteria bacterium]|nr:hypothetical protein [Candidatus Levybacteria bacterium]